MEHAAPIELDTPRLRLRAWREADLAPFAALVADPQVMEFFPATLSRAESDALVASFGERMARNGGWGFWAAEHKASGELIGFVGLNRPAYALPFGPCVEVGWRLARRWWGQGLASEAARASLAFGFGRLELDEIVAFTTLANARSRAVMARLGMAEDPSRGFDHPLLAEGHALRRHCLYAIGREAWRAASE